MGVMLAGWRKKKKKKKKKVEKTKQKSETVRS
jgi:hypothetical protein